MEIQAAVSDYVGQTIIDLLSAQRFRWRDSESPPLLSQPDGHFVVGCSIAFVRSPVHRTLHTLGSHGMNNEDL